MQLSIYPQNFAFVNREVHLSLEEGLNEVAIDQMPLKIDEKSLIFSFPNNDCQIEQYFVSTNNKGQSSLNLLIMSPAKSDYILNLNYKVFDISYDIFYNFIYNPQTQSIDINGWVEVLNKSYVSLEDVNLHIVINYQDDKNIKFDLENTYRLSHSIPIRIPFIFKNNIPVLRKFILPYNKNQVIECVSFINNEEHGLGVSLMAGNMSLYFKDEDNNLQNIDNDLMGIYFPNDEILLKISSADHLVSVKRNVNKDSTITINLHNRSNFILNIDIELGINQIIDQCNTPLYIDEDEWIHTQVKLNPSSLEKINYKFAATEISTI